MAFAFLANMFGSAKVGEKLVDNISSGIDKIWHTAEEKADDIAKARTEGYAVYMKWLESTSGSRLARRFIAMITVGIWAVEHIAAVMMAQIGVFIEDSAKFIKASEMLAGYAQENNTLVGVVLLFYFGGPAATDAVKGMVTKWVDKKK